MAVGSGVGTAAASRPFAFQLGRTARYFVLPRHAVFAALASLNVLVLVQPWTSIGGVLAGLVGAVATLPAGFGGRGLHGARLAAVVGGLLVAIAIVSGADHVRARLTAAPITSASLSALKAGHDRLMTIVLTTAPRPGDPDFLGQTLDSYLVNLPADSSSDTRLIVYNHFSQHAAYDTALAARSGSASPVEWVRRPAPIDRLDQRLHVARAIAYAAATSDSRYIMLAEDDFPLCEPATQSWSKLLRALGELDARMPDRADGAPGHCGLFVGTGGSGLIVRTEIARRLPALLLGTDDVDGERRERDGADILVERAPDLVIQDCLRGLLPGCEMCAVGGVASAAASATGAGSSPSARDPFGTPGDRRGKSGLAATDRLLMRHLGYDHSTVRGRTYPASWAQCGQRHPFVRCASLISVSALTIAQNGDADVLIV